MRRGRPFATIACASQSLRLAGAADGRPRHPRPGRRIPIGGGFPGHTGHCHAAYGAPFPRAPGPGASWPAALHGPAEPGSAAARRLAPPSSRLAAVSDLLPGRGISHCEEVSLRPRARQAGTLLRVRVTRELLRFLPPGIADRVAHAVATSRGAHRGSPQAGTVEPPMVREPVPWRPLHPAWSLQGGS